MNKIERMLQELCPNEVEYKKLGELFNVFSGMKGVSNKWADNGNCKFIDYLNVYNTSFPQLFYPLMTRQFFCDFHEKYEDFCVS